MTGALLGLVEPAGAPRPDLLAAVRAALRSDEPPGALAATVDDLLPALVASVPEALDRHRALGLSEEVSRDTLADVGRKVSAYGASLPPDWLVGLLRADVVALGRLQFGRLPEAGRHAVHVPELGPLLPSLVDASLRRAAEELGATAFTCESWLLDPLLAAGLPAGSNIVRFAARFAVPAVVRPQGAAPTPADREVARFVFRRPLEEVLDAAAVTPRTTLERLVAHQLRSGGHWTQPPGVLGPAPPE